MDLTTLQSELARFSGGTARLHSYTSSHDRLTLELGDARDEHRVSLMLIGCTKIQVSSWWRVVDLRIESMASGFVMRDEGMEVLFEHEFQVVEGPASR